MANNEEFWRFARTLSPQERQALADFERAGGNWRDFMKSMATRGQQPSVGGQPDVPGGQSEYLFGPKLKESMSELQRLVEKSRARNFQVSAPGQFVSTPPPDVPIPGNILDLHTALLTTLGGANVEVGQPTILHQLYRGRKDIEAAESWVVPITRAYGEHRESVLDIGLTPGGALFAAPGGHASGFGIIPPAFMKTERGIQELSPLSVLSTALKTNLEDYLWKAITDAGAVWHNIGIGASAADIEQLARRAFIGFGGQTDIANVAPGVNTAYFSGSHGQEISTLGMGIPSRKMVVQGDLDEQIVRTELAVSKAKRLKVESHAEGVPSGLTPGAPIETYTAPFSYAGVLPEIVARQRANLGFSPFGMPGEGMAATHTPMAEIVRGRELELNEQQAAALKETKGKIFIDRKARFAGGLGGMERAGTMRDLYDMMGGEYTPSGVAAILEDLVETSPGKYLPMLRMFSQGSSLKHLFKAFNVQAGAGQNVYSVGENRSPIDFDITTRISMEDINMIARASVAANFPTARDFLEGFFIPQAASLYQAAVEGDEQARAVYTRLAAALGEDEAAGLTGFSHKRGYKAQSERLAKALFTEKTGRVRGEEAAWLEMNPAAEELFQTLAVRDLTSRIELTTAASPRPVSIEDFSMFLSAGLQVAGVSDIPNTVSEQFKLYTEMGLHKQTFGAREYERFDPTGIRLVGGKTLDEASGVLIPRITAPTIPTWLNALVRPEHFNESTVIGQDVLQTFLSTGRGEMVDVLDELVSSGILPQPARRAAIAHFANVSSESREFLAEQGLEEFNAATWSNIVSKGIDEGMTFSAAVMRAAEQYGEESGTPGAAGYRVRVGETEMYIPNPADLVRTAVLKEEELIGSKGSPLKAMGEFLSSLNVMGIDPQYEAATRELMAKYQESMDIFFDLPGVQKKVLGTEVPHIGGHIQIFQGVPSGIYMNLRDIQELTGMRPEEIFWRAGLTQEELPESERLTASAILDPGADPKSYGATALLRPTEGPYPEKIQEALNKNPVLGVGQAAITADLVRAQVRDADGDNARIWISMGMAKIGGALRKVGAALGIVPREELARAGVTAAGSEVQKQAEIYRATEAMMFEGKGMIGTIREAGYGGWTSEKDLLGEAATRARSQASIGGMYNLYNRELVTFQAELAKATGLTKEGSRTLSTAVSRMSQGVLQTALDMLSVTEAKATGGTPETGILNFAKLARTLGMRPGESAWGPITTMRGGQEIQWKGPAGGPGIDENLKWITQNVLFNMGESFWGKEEKPSQDYLNFLPALATSMMSVASIGNKDFEARRDKIVEMIYQNALYQRQQGGKPADMEEYLSLSGAESWKELGAGTAADPGRASVLHGFLTALSSIRAEEWGEKRTKKDPKIPLYKAGFGGVQKLMEFAKKGAGLVGVSSAVSGKNPAKRKTMEELVDMAHEAELVAGQPLPSMRADVMPVGELPRERFVSASEFSAPRGEELEWAVADIINTDREAADIGTEFHKFLMQAMKDDPKVLSDILGEEYVFESAEQRTPEIVLGEAGGYTYKSGGRKDASFTVGPLKGVLEIKTGKSEGLERHRPQVSIYGRASGADLTTLIYTGDNPELSDLIKNRQFAEALDLMRQPGKRPFTRIDIASSGFTSLEELAGQARDVYEANLAAPVIAGEAEAPGFGRALSVARARIAGNLSALSGGGTVGPSGGGAGGRQRPPAPPSNLPPGDLPPGDENFVRLAKEQYDPLLEAMQGAGGGRRPYKPRPPTAKETAEFFEASRYLAGVSRTLAEEGSQALSGLSASGILRNLDVYRKHAKAMSTAELEGSTVAGAAFGVLDETFAREFWREEDPELAWRMLQFGSKEEFEDWMANKPGSTSIAARRQEIIRPPLRGASEEAIYRQSLREPEREFSILSGAGTKARALARQMTASAGEITGEGFTGDVEKDATALIDTFKKLSTTLQEVRKGTEGFNDLTEKQAAALKESSKAVQTFTTYFNELVREADNIAKARGVTQEQAVEYMPEERKAQLLTLQKFFGETVPERELVADLTMARESGELQTKSRARSMRAMGAYYGMRAIQRTWEMAVQGPAYAAGEYTGLEEGLVGGAGFGPTEFHQLRSAQENAQLRRMYSQYELLGWAGQIGAQLGQIPEVSRVAATAQAGFGAYMSSLLMRESVEALFGKPWMEKTSAGKRISKVPGIVGGLALGATALETGFQISNYLGLSEDLSLGGLLQSLVSGMGVNIGRQPELISRRAMLDYMQDARTMGYSAQVAGGITGVAAGQFGYQYAAQTDASGRTMGQRLAMQAGTLSVEPSQYAQQIFGIAQQWSPLNREAQYGVAGLLEEYRIPLQGSEAWQLARNQLVNELAPSRGETVWKETKKGAALWGSIMAGVGMPGGLPGMAALGLKGVIGGGAYSAIKGYVGYEDKLKDWERENLTEEQIQKRAEELVVSGKAAGTAELQTLTAFMSQFGTQITGLKQVYGREDAGFLNELLYASGGGANLNWTLQQALGFGRGAEIATQVGLGTGLTIPLEDIGRYRERLAGLQEYQYQGVLAGATMMAPYIRPGQDLMATSLAAFQGQTALGTQNIMTWMQTMAGRGYDPTVTGGMARTLGQMEPWRAASITGISATIQQMTGIPARELGDFEGNEAWQLAERTRRWRGAGEELTASDQALLDYLVEQGVMEAPEGPRPGKLRGIAQALSGLTEYQLGGVEQLLPMALSQITGGDVEAQTGAMLGRLSGLVGGLRGRKLGQALTMGELVFQQGGQLTEFENLNRLAGILGPTAMGTTVGLGQTIAGLGFEGPQYERMLVGAGAYTGLMGWQAGQQAAGFMGWSYGMGLQPGQAVDYGYQYGAMFQHPFMAQAFQQSVGQLMGIGAEFQGASTFAAPLITGSTQLERRRFSGFLGGDTLEYSRMLTGEDRFSANLRAQLERAGLNLSGLSPLMDVQTGMSVFARPETMRRAGLQGLSQYEIDYQRMMMPYMDERGQIMTAPGGDPMTWQFMRAQEDYQMGRAFTFGGTFTAAGQQYTVPMGALDIQERLFGISTEQRRYDFAFQERQLGVSRRRFEEGMAVSKEQTRRQYEWNVQDWEYSEGRAQLGFAWQMEDYDEQLRFARGRERRLLMRQRDRATIAYTMERGHQADIRGRMDEQYGWQEEALERQKRYYEEDEALSRERLDRQRQFYEQSRELQQQQMEMERMRAMANDQIARRELQHSQMMMQKTYELQQAEWNIKIVQEQAQSAMYLFYSQQLPQAVSEMSSSITASFASFFEAIRSGIASVSSAGVTPAPPAGATVLEYQGGGYTGGTFITSHEAAQFNAMVAMGARTFDDGGPTGGNMPNKPSGVVHEGEYVVPQGGSLVVRGDQQVDLLRQILATLNRIEKKGGAGLTVNLKSREVREAVNATLDLYDQSYRR